MSDVAAVYPTQTVIKCDVCGTTNNIKWFCKNCPGSLCDTCRDSHKTTDISRKHVIVQRTGSVVRTHGPAKIAEECQQHKGKDISTYCLDCSVPCCVKCLADHHQRHEFRPIDEVYSDTEIRLNAYIKEIEDEVLPQLDAQQFIDKTKDNVNSFRKEIKNIVDDTCDEFIDNLQTGKNEFINNMQKQMQNVLQIISECKDKIREGKLDLMQYKPPKPSSLIPKPTIVPLFTPKGDLLDVIRKGLGTTGYAGESGSSRGNEKSTQTSMQSAEGIVQISFECTIGASAISSAGNDRAWVTHSQCDTLRLYDDKGVNAMSITVMSSVGIFDIVTKKSGDVIVANKDMKVRLVSPQGKVTNLIDTAPFTPKGVCLTDSEQIVVCMNG